MMDFDLRSLAHARAVADHASFARAAKALHITQPALSRSIQELERRIGAKLFDRLAGRVEPTEVGRLFLDHARDVLARAEDLSRQIELLRGVSGGALVVGAGTYAAEGFIDQVVAKVVATHPEVTVRVVVDHWANLLFLMRKREVDVAIADASALVDETELETALLARHAGYLIVRAGHPLTHRVPVALEDVLDFPVVSTARLPSRLIEPLLNAARRSRKRSGPQAIPSIACESLGMMKTIAAGSDAVALLPLNAVTAEPDAGWLVVLPLIEPWLYAEFSVIRLAHRPLSPLAETFVAALREIHQAIVAGEHARERLLMHRGPTRTLRNAGVS